MMQTPALSADLREALELSASIARRMGPVKSGAIAARRRAQACRRHWNEGGPQAFRLETRLPGPTRSVPVVVYKPLAAATAPLPVFVYFHGGGFRLGTAMTNDRQMREIAQAWGGAVISADYLHVPEHVFPSAVEEAACILQQVRACASRWGLDGDRIACGGNSAGAVLALGAAVHLGGPSWLRAGVGIVGAFSWDTSTPSMQAYGDAGLFPDRAAVKAIFDDYLPEPGSRSDPRADLLNAPAGMLPPTFLAAAEFDVFLDGSRAMADRLAAAERLDALKVYSGMSHLFFGFSRSVAQAKACIEDIADFLARRLGSPGHPLLTRP